LLELVPGAAVIALLANPKLRESENTVSEAQTAARILSWELLVLNASTPDKITAAFVILSLRRAAAARNPSAGTHTS